MILDVFNDLMIQIILNWTKLLHDLRTHAVVSDTLENVLGAQQLWKALRPFMNKILQVFSSVYPVVLKKFQPLEADLTQGQWAGQRATY